MPCILLPKESFKGYVKNWAREGFRPCGGLGAEVIILLFHGKTTTYKHKL